MNILVLCEENETIKIIEPFGKLQVFDGVPFALIYKKDNMYECLLYHYNDKSYGVLSKKRDTEILKKGDVIYTMNETAVITKVIRKSNLPDKFAIKYISKGIVSEIEENDSIHKYDRECIYNILEEFINSCRDKVVSNKKGIITSENIQTVMEELKYKRVTGYYDTYHKLVACSYKKGSLNDISIFFKPQSKDGLSYSIEPLNAMPEYTLQKILDSYKEIDTLIQKKYKGEYLNFLDETTKIMVNGANLIIGLSLSNGFIVPLKRRYYRENQFTLETIANESMLSLQRDQLNLSEIPDKPSKSDEYFIDFNQKQNDMYEIFTLVYNEIMKNKNSLQGRVNKIIDHPIKLRIHKRHELLDLLLLNDKIRDRSSEKGSKIIKIFIEYLCIHGIKELHKTLFQNYSSLKYYKTNEKSDEFIILSAKEIVTEAYSYLFHKKSDFIRNISYYEESNPDINKSLLKREDIDEPVSWHTKYPNLLKKLFKGELKILKNLVSEHKNDISILSRSLKDSLERPDINEDNLREILLSEYRLSDDSYLDHNHLSNEMDYQNNRELLAEVDAWDYNLSLVDFDVLSKNLEIGFVIFTNRYTNSETKFQTHIKIHKNLILDTSCEKLDIPMLCLYEDYSEIDNTECKPISINGKSIHNLSDLRRSSEIDDIFKRFCRSLST